MMPMSSLMTEILHRGRQGEKTEKYVGIFLYSFICKHLLSWSCGQEYRVPPRHLLPGCMYSFVIGIRAGDSDRGNVCNSLLYGWLFQILSSLPNFLFFSSPQFSCCCSFRTVLRKLPSVSRVFSCNHCIASI